MPRRWPRLLLTTWLSLAPVRMVRADDANDDPGRPAVRTLSAREIQAKGPIYAFAKTSGNGFFVGSDALSVYDGPVWHRIDVPDAREFRALAAAPETGAAGFYRERVWVGAVGAIGYVERNSVGSWGFVSLEPQLKAAGLSRPRDIGFASAVGDGAVFVLAHAALRWTGARFEIWSMDGASPLQAVAGGDRRVWILQSGTGLFLLGATGPPVLVRADQYLPPGPANWILAPREHASAAARPSADPASGMLVGTSFGSYRLTEAGYERLPELSAVINGQKAIHAAALDGDLISVGTFRNGITVATRNGKVVSVLNRANGLRDDNVYGMWNLPNGDLWVGLDDSCQRLSSIGRVSMFDARDGIERGSLRRVFAHKGTTFLLTSKALYRVDTASNGATHMAPVIASSPVLRDALILPDRLWVSGIDGLWLADSRGANLALHSTGQIGRLAPAPGRPGGLIYSEDSSIKLLEPAGGGEWRSTILPLHLGGSVVSLLSEANGDFWDSTTDEGIYRCRLGPGESPADARIVAHYREGAGLPGPLASPVLLRLASRFYACDSNQVLAFDGTGGFQRAPELAGWMVIAGANGRTRPDPSGARVTTAYVVARRLGVPPSFPYAVLRADTADGDPAPPRWNPIRIAGLDDIGAVTSLDVLKSGAREFVWIGGVDGAVRFDSEQAKPGGPLSMAQIREVRCDEGAPLALRPDKPVAIGPDSHLVRFSYSTAESIELGDAFYQTRLIGAEFGWSSPQLLNERSFTGLASGSYDFRVRRIDRWGRPGPAVGYPFNIVAPWYMRWPALVGYAIGLVVVTASALRWRVRILERQAENLNHLVDERTRELSLSNTAKAEFLENISHEIRNPLNGIAGLIGMLDEANLEGKQRSCAQALKECSGSLLRAFDEVLNFSRLEYGHVPLDERPFSLIALVDTVRAVFLSTAARQGSTLTVRAPSDFVDGFWGDERKIETILNNFVGNALKFAPGTAVEIALSCQALDADRAEVLIEVTDQGPGVPPEEQALIFKKFVRGTRARESNVAGAGIGLATCRVMARLLGGSVGIESPAAATGGDGGPPRGATFFLSLTLARRNLAEAPAQPAPRPDLAEVPWALIVEDQKYNQIVLADILNELGYRTECADDGEHALEEFGRRPFRLAFVDLELPGISGAEIAVRLREFPGGENLTIIGTSADDGRNAAQRSRAAGMDAFLLKPLHAGRIRAAIEVQTRRRGAPGDEVAVDCSAFVRHARNSPGGFVEAARVYVDVMHGEVRALEDALDRNSRDETARAAHRVRSHASIVGAVRLGRAAGLVEDAARSHRLPDCGQAMASVRAEAGLVERALSEEVLTNGRERG